MDASLQSAAATIKRRTSSSVSAGSFASGMPTVAGSSALRRGTMTSVTVIRFSVSVPVLSVRITLVEPNVSTAESCSTSALRRAIRRMPRASARVATIGQTLGHGCDRESDRRFDDVGELLAAQEAENSDDGDQGNAEPPHHLAEGVDSFFERRFLVGCLLHQSRDRPRVGLHTRLSRPRRLRRFPWVMAVPLNNMLSRSASSVVLRQNFDCLFDGNGLPGQE